MLMVPVDYPNFPEVNSRIMGKPSSNKSRRGRPPILPSPDVAAAARLPLPRFDARGFAGRLQLLRKARGLTRNELALLVRVDRKTMDKWLNGGGGGVETVNLLALASPTVFGEDLSLTWLLTGAGPQRLSSSMETSALENALCAEVERRVRHIEPVTPPSPFESGYNQWLDAEKMLRLLALEASRERRDVARFLWGRAAYQQLAAAVRQDPTLKPALSAVVLSLQEPSELMGISDRLSCHTVVESKFRVLTKKKSP